MSIETLKGLYLLESLTTPVPDTITQYLKDNFATGTGPYGTFTVMDFVGTAAGANVTNLMLQVPTLIGTMDVAVLQGLYNDMLATVSGTYGPNTGPVTIPAGPAAGVYATGDLAFTTGLIPAAQAEIANLIVAYPTETANLNNAFNTISEQIFREAVNQAKTGLNYDSLPGGIQSNALSFASSLAQYGQDNTPKNASEFLNTVAQFNTLPGQAIIGALREGRNYQSLNRAGIPSTNFAVPSTYPSSGTAVLTPLPPVQPPIIPAPPAAQIPANATSTDYTVTEARLSRLTSIALSEATALGVGTVRAVLPGAVRAVTNSLDGMIFPTATAPSVVPGPVPVPPPGPRIGYNPPPSVDGPTIRLVRSSGSLAVGEFGIIDAEVLFGAMNSFPIGTQVPYSITGVDPSLITVTSVAGFSGRAGSGSGIPLSGTFEITSTRSGGFGIVVSPALSQDAVLTINVEGALTYVGILAQNFVAPQPTLDILAVYPQITVNGVVQPGEPTTSIEVAKNFYARVRARPSAAFITGSISVKSGTVSSALIPINYTDYSASEQGDLFLVPGSIIPSTGSAVLTFTCSPRQQFPDFSGSVNLEIVSPRYTKNIFAALNGWVVGSAQRITQQVIAGSNFNIVVTGEPNTTFNWSGFGGTGTTATADNGFCVFPSQVAPSLTQYATNPFRVALGDGGRDTYPFTVTWPDSTVTQVSIDVTEYRTLGDVVTGAGV
jgi:hypothetical protein